MASVPIDDNFVKGLLVKGETTGADVVVLGDETTKAMLVKPVDFETPDGDSMVDDTNDALKTVISGSITPGTGATNLGKAEDAAHTSGDVGVMSLAVRNDVLATLAVADGDYAPFQVNSAGSLYVEIASGSVVIAAGTNEIGKLAAGVAEIGNVKNSGTFAVQSTLQTGSAAIGKLAANSGVNIGDVDVLSLPAITGTVTANLSATDNTVLDNIDTSTASKYITGIAHGVKTITTAGTDEALAGSTACKRVTIQAQTDNTGGIAVGATGVDATEATGTGVLLGAGDAFELEIDNLADVYIDSTVNGEGVRYSYFT